eukprot:4625836-Lingulodinium_polyedra.AAC.1
MHEGGGEELEDVSWEIGRVSRRLKQLQKDYRCWMEELLTAQLEEAWQERRMAQAWKIAYRLGNRGQAPKKRVYRNLGKGEPSVQEWV